MCLIDFGTSVVRWPNGIGGLLLCLLGGFSLTVLEAAWPVLCLILCLLDGICMRMYESVYMCVCRVCVVCACVCRTCAVHVYV